MSEITLREMYKQLNQIRQKMIKVTTIHIFISLSGFSAFGNFYSSLYYDDYSFRVDTLTEKRVRRWAISMEELLSDPTGEIRAVVGVWRGAGGRGRYFPSLLFAFLFYIKKNHLFIYYLFILFYFLSFFDLFID